MVMFETMRLGAMKDQNNISMLGYEGSFYSILSFLKLHLDKSYYKSEKLPMPQPLLEIVNVSLNPYYKRF